MRVGQQQGAVTNDVGRRLPSGRQRSMRRLSPLRCSFDRERSSLMSGGGLMLAGVVGITSLFAGAFAGSGPDREADSGSTVFTPTTTLDSPFAPSEPSAAFGIGLLEIEAGVVALGTQGISGTTASVILVPETGAPTVADVVFAEKTVAASSDILVVIDTARLRVTTIGEDGRLTEVANHVRLDDSRFGTVADLGGPTLAVLRDHSSEEPAIVEVFDLNDGVTPVVAFAPGLERVSIAVDTTGALVAVSGVRGQAAVGEVQLFRRAGDVWLVDARFEAIGGGTIQASSTAPETFYVQRNGFFTQPTGTWTNIEPDDTGILQASREWSVQSSSLAVTDRLAAFGRPNDEQVMTFTFDASDPFDSDDASDPLEIAGLANGSVLFEQPAPRHAQSVSAPIPVPTDGTPARRRPPASQFGTSLVFVHGRLVISGPGSAIDGVVDEGSIFVFDATSGPAGCTITGTDDHDTLNGTTADDVICGLGGNDVIRGNVGFDRIYGGDGDDDLSGDADNDLLVGGPGDDRLAGGAGEDSLVGGPGRDALYGGAGTDRLNGGPDRDACFGGADIDTFEDC